MIPELWNSFKFLPARLKKMQQGAHFLLDTCTQMLQQGLIRVANWDPSHIEHISQRLIDFQLPVPAGKFRYLRDNLSEPGKEAAVRFELRWLILFARRMLAFEKLDISSKFDVWQAAGAQIKKDFVLTSPGMYDRWQVRHVSLEQEQQLYTRKVWLQGEHSRSRACIIDHVYGNKHFERQYYLDKVYQMDMHFYPGTLPLRAIAGEERPGRLPSPPQEKLPASVKALYSRLLAILDAQPLLIEYFFTVKDCYLHQSGDEMHLRDQEGFTLPVDASWPGAWQQLATLGGRPGDFNLLWQRDIWQVIY